MMLKFVFFGIAASNVEALWIQRWSLPRSRNLSSRVHLPQIADITFLSSLNIDNPVGFLEEAAGIGFIGKATQVMLLVITASTHKIENIVILSAGFE